MGASIRHSVDPRNELPSHYLAIAFPVFAVLDGTPLEITGRAVNKHGDEEDAIEVRDGRCCADDQAPGEAHGPVCHVVWFTRDSPPATSEKTIAMRCLDVGRVLDCAPWQLGERPTIFVVALGLHLETTFLRHGGIPYVVRREQRAEERDVSRGRKSVLFRLMGSHVNDRINIGEWNPRKVPEDNHETPLFVEHIPRLWDTLFAFAACVQIKPGRKAHECHIGGDNAILFILLACARDRQEEDDNPRDADFRPHFQVHRADSRIERGAHEDIVYEVTRHAHLLTTCDGPKVSPKGYSEAPDYGDRHDVTIVVDDLRQTEYVVIMEERGGDKGEVDRVERIAVVHEGLVSQRWHGQAFLHVALA